MPTVTFYFRHEMPIDCPITKDGQQVGKVIDCKPADKRFLITAEVTQEVVLALHQPPTSIGAREKT